MALTSLDGRLDSITHTHPHLDAYLEKLERFVRDAPDHELERINVLEWANAHGVPPNDALDLFLCASNVGVFDLSWVLMCPLCGLRISTRGALQQVARGATCSFCRRAVTISLDDNVEVVFGVAAAVRKLVARPMNDLEQVRAGFLDEFYSRSMEHNVMHQTIARSLSAARWLSPGESTTLSLDLKAGPWVLAAPQVHAVTHLEASEGGNPDQSLELLDGELVGGTTLAIGPVKLTVRNRTTQRLLVLWASTSWTQTFDWASAVTRFKPMITAKQLLTNQTFRELHRNEGVGIEGGMQLRSLAILFTDLTASTELYERVGDLRALDLVRRHFEVLEKVIAAERGAVVKTIGDAVMASFAEPERALAAAASMHRQMGLLGASEALTLKIGVHVGSCVAIESNQQLDFFGRTVNVAARVQAKAGAGEVVITQDVLDHPAAREIARTQFGAITQERVHLKGIEGDVLVHRLHQPA